MKRTLGQTDTDADKIAAVKASVVALSAEYGLPEIVAAWDAVEHMGAAIAAHPKAAEIAQKIGALLLRAAMTSGLSPMTLMKIAGPPDPP